MIRYLPRDTGYGAAPFALMPKLKTRKSLAKRLRFTANGKVTRAKAWAQTLRRKKSGRARRAKGGETPLTSGQARSAHRLIRGG